jgi:hypothetical protein
VEVPVNVSPGIVAAAVVLVICLIVLVGQL